MLRNIVPHGTLSACWLCLSSLALGFCLTAVCTGACSNSTHSQGAVTESRSRRAFLATSAQPSGLVSPDWGNSRDVFERIEDAALAGDTPVEQLPGDAENAETSLQNATHDVFAKLPVSEPDPPCDDYRTAKWAKKYFDRYGSKRKFGYDGYLYRQVLVERNSDGSNNRHCLRVYFPGGDKTAEGKRVRLIDYITPAWYRLIYNTMQRLPWSHVRVVKAIVIDDRPSLHGVASFSREKPEEDARDGHTIWLNKRLFLQPNGIVRGNYGFYWGYRINVDHVTIKGLGPEHDYFSPVLLHEIGHLIMYNRVNGNPADVTCPSCAQMCGDKNQCDKISQYEKEVDCVTPYCTGFGFSSGTENFAEMYRWYYQGETTRKWLQQYYSGCYNLLHDMDDGLPAPWQRGLTQVQGYVPSRWSSCKSIRAKTAKKDWAGRCIAHD